VDVLLFEPFIMRQALKRRPCLNRVYAGSPSGESLDLVRCLTIGLAVTFGLGVRQDMKNQRRIQPFRGCSALVSTERII